MEIRERGRAGIESGCPDEMTHSQLLKQPPDLFKMQFQLEEWSGWLIQAMELNKLPNDMYTFDKYIIFGVHSFLNINGKILAAIRSYLQARKLRGFPFTEKKKRLRELSSKYNLLFYKDTSLVAQVIKTPCVKGKIFDLIPPNPLTLSQIELQVYP